MPVFQLLYTSAVHQLTPGVLAVTRSLGDASMKEFVVGAPYTTQTDLDDEDEFLIVACDGVSVQMSLGFPSDGSSGTCATIRTRSI